MLQPVNKMYSQFAIQTFNSAILTTDSTIYKYPINFSPDFWVVVARLSVGFMWIYPEAGPGGLSFRLDKGQLVLPIHSQTLTVITVGATGWFDVYPVKDPDGFDLEA